MISKEKIKKLDIYTESGERILTTNRFTFPRDFFKIKGVTCRCLIRKM